LRLQALSRWRPSWQHGRWRLKSLGLAATGPSNDAEGFAATRFVLPVFNAPQALPRRRCRKGKVAVLCRLSFAKTM
jgi:hypothetical protein